MSGTLTLTPPTGVARVVRVRSGLIYPTEVPAGRYELTGAVRAVGDVASTLLDPVTVVVAGSRADLSTKTPAPVPAVLAGASLSIIEREPGVYEVTGATVAETQPGTYTLTV